MKPIRIQRKRIKGWRMPEHTICVSRPSTFGNPFIVGKPVVYEGFLYKVKDAKHSVGLYEKYVVKAHQQELLIKMNLEGWNLACWCSLDQPCHADILLKIANES